MKNSVNLPTFILTFEQQEELKEHYKNKLWIGIKNGERPRKYSTDERQKIGAMYDTIVAAGYMVTGIDNFDRLTYSKRVKSAVQIMLEEGLATA